MASLLDILKNYNKFLLKYIRASSLMLNISLSFLAQIFFDYTISNAVLHATQKYIHFQTRYFDF